MIILFFIFALLFLISKKVQQFIKSAKITFCFAALLFVAKPFLGFSMFSRVHQPCAQNIFVKAFAKRKLEERETNKVNTESIQKNIKEAAAQFTLRFAALLTILLPVIFQPKRGFLRKLRVHLSPTEPAWILNCKLII